MTVICDLDGTVFDDRQRIDTCERLTGEEAFNGKKFWECYFDDDAMALDTPIDGAHETLSILAKKFGVWYISGRLESTRGVTQRMLDEYGFPKGQLNLKPDRLGVERKGTWTWKVEQYRLISDVVSVEAVIDDNEEMVASAIRMGLRAFLVPPYDEAYEWAVQI